MEALLFINAYIKYIYFVLIVTIIILIIKMIKELKPVAETIKHINGTIQDINENIEEINIKVNKIKYTLEHSIPFFAFLFFIIIVIISTLQDYFNTKKNKRNFTKSAVRQYGIMNLKFNPKKVRKNRKEFVSQFKKLA